MNKNLTRWTPAMLAAIALVATIAYLSVSNPGNQEQPDREGNKLKQESQKQPTAPVTHFQLPNTQIVMKGRYILDLNEDGRADCQIIIDGKLYKHWATANQNDENTGSLALDCALHVIQNLQGQLRLPKQIVVYWEQRENSPMKQHIPGNAGGVTFRDPSGDDRIFIFLFGDDPPLYHLAHELSHANTFDLGLPVAMDEGEAVLMQLFFEELWLRRNEEPGIDKVLVDLANGRFRGKTFINFVLASPSTRGWEPHNGTIVYDHWGIGYHQYATFGNTFYQLILVNCLAQPMRNINKEFLDWASQLDTVTMEGCKQFFSREGNAIPGKQGIEGLCLFRQPQRGLYLNPINLSTEITRHADGSMSFKESAFVLFFRETGNEFPATHVTVQTEEREWGLNLPEYGGMFKIPELFGEKGETVTIWKTDEPSVRCSYNLRRLPAKQKAEPHGPALPPR